MHWKLSCERMVYHPTCVYLVIFSLHPPTTNSGIDEKMTYCSHQTNEQFDSIDCVCVGVSVWDTGGLNSSLWLMAQPVKIRKYYYYYYYNSSFHKLLNCTTFHPSHGLHQVVVQYVQHARASNIQSTTSGMGRGGGEARLGTV